MAFKDFMIWHVTEYEPAMLLSLAEDWPAIQEWDLQTEQGQNNIVAAFGGDHIEVLEYWSPTYSPYFADTDTQYATIEEFVEALEKAQDYAYKYT